MNDVLFTLTKSKTLTQGDLNSALDEITQAAANTFEVERVSVWLYNSDRSKMHCLNLYEQSLNRYLWCAQDIHAIANPAEKFTLASVFPRWAEVLGKGEIIASIVAELPESEREILSSQKTLSILVLPLKVNNQFWGFIGFDNCVEVGLWEPIEVDLLAAATAAISLHQERALAQQHLAQAKEDLEIQVSRRTKALKKANQQLLVEIAERTAAQRTQAHLYAQAQEAVSVAQQHSQKLQQALEELTKAQSLIVQSEKMSSLGQLVAGVAHEINNPISFISGNLAHANQYILELLDILHLYQEHYRSIKPTQICS